MATAPRTRDNRVYAANRAAISTSPLIQIELASVQRRQPSRAVFSNLPISSSRPYANSVARETTAGQPKKLACLVVWRLIQTGTIRCSKVALVGSAQRSIKTNS